jgi:hypothetical protein
MGVAMDFLKLGLTFDEKRAAKWRAGRAERGLPLDAPFKDDPVLEALSETPDLANYIEEAIKQGRIPDYVGRELIREVRSIDAAISMYR